VAEHFVRHLEGAVNSGLLVAEVKQLVIGMITTVSTLSSRLLMPPLRSERGGSLKAKGLVTTRCQGTALLSDFGDYGSGTVPVPPPIPAVMKPYPRR